MTSKSSHLASDLESGISPDQSAGLGVPTRSAATPNLEILTETLSPLHNAHRHRVIRGEPYGYSLVVDDEGRKIYVPGPITAFSRLESVLPGSGPSPSSLEPDSAPHSGISSAPPTPYNADLGMSRVPMPPVRKSFAELEFVSPITSYPACETFYHRKGRAIRFSTKNHDLSCLDHNNDGPTTDHNVASQPDRHPTGIADVESGVPRNELQGSWPDFRADDSPGVSVIDIAPPAYNDEKNAKAYEFANPFFSIDEEACFETVPLEKARRHKLSITRLANTLYDLFIDNPCWVLAYHQICDGRNTPARMRALKRVKQAGSFDYFLSSCVVLCLLFALSVRSVLGGLPALCVLPGGFYVIHQAYWRLLKRCFELIGRGEEPSWNTDLLREEESRVQALERKRGRA